MAADTFLLTQAFSAMMLGVRRTGVTAATGALQRAGIIRYSRGNVVILDRRGLERRSCECYGISKLEFDRLLGVQAAWRLRSRKMRSKIIPDRVGNPRLCPLSGIVDPCQSPIANALTLSPRICSSLHIAPSNNEENII
jgi:hypothetical protein